MLVSYPLFTLEPLEPRRILSAVADVDLAFGIGGTTPLITDFRPRLNDGDITMYVQADGKVLVAGSLDDSDSFFIQRYNPDGTRDPAFHGGIRHIRGVDTSSIQAVRARRDGSIFIIGSQLLRLDPSGEFVASYGPWDSTVTDWAVDANGKVIVADPENGILRYNADGSRDGSFNHGGNAVDLVDFGYVRNIRPTADGKIVVDSFTMDFDGNEYDQLYRLNADGSLDDTFKNGYIDVVWGESYRSLNLMPDGSILLAGGAGWREDDFVVRKFMPDGTPDNTFDDDGHVRTNLGSHSDILSYAMAEPDGGVMAVGTYGDSYYVKIRYRPDGSLDTDWGNQGRMFSRLRDDIVDWSAASDLSGGVVALSLPMQDINGDWDKPVTGFLLTRYVFTNAEPGASTDEETDDESTSDEDTENEDVAFDDSVWWNEDNDDESWQTDQNSDDLLDVGDQQNDQVNWSDESDVWG